MVHLRKSFVWKLLIVGLLTVHAASAGDSRADKLKLAMKKKAVRIGTIKLVKPLMADFYRLLINEGVVPKVNHALLRFDQNYGGSPFHKLARTWHAVLMFQLTAARIPESWKTAAAAAHKKLGGRGEFIQALPDSGRRGRVLNLASGPLREEFLSYALFFLNAFVPDDISACASKKLSEAEECIGQYEEELQTALLATFSSFFQYVVPRTPSSRIATTSFVFAAVSPCPFGYLVEPAFVARVLQGAPRDSLKHFASIKRVASAKPCPDLKKALLQVLLLNGVTPADMMKTKQINEELGKIAASASAMVMEKTKEIIAALDPKTGLMEAFEGAAEPEELLAQLAAFMGANATEKDAQSFGADYLDRVKTLLEGLDVGAFKPPSMSMEDLMKGLSDAIAAEAESNPHRAALKPEKKMDSLEMEAQEVLKQMRNFDLQTKTFLPDDDEK